MKKISCNKVLILFNKTIFSHKIFNFFNFDESQIFISKNIGNRLGSTIENDNIINIFYNLNNGVCGIYYLTGRELDIVKNILFDKNINKNLFIFEVINKSLEMGAKFKANFIKNKKYILEIQDNRTLSKLKTYYVKNFNA
jgi:hypothetical protein